MFHKAIDIKFHKGTTLDVTYMTGEVKRFDMASLFLVYPKLRRLENRKLFTSGRLVGNYGLVWDDELDIELETIYQEGECVGFIDIGSSVISADAVRSARARIGISQEELSIRSGIDQSDISKIERGLSNPSVKTLDRIAKALDLKLRISLE